MPTFETLPRFERDWKHLIAQQQTTFRKVITDAFVPDLAAPDRPFRPGLRVKGVTAHPGEFEMTCDHHRPRDLQLRRRAHPRPGPCHLAAGRLGHAVAGPAAGGLAEHGGELAFRQRPAAVGAAGRRPPRPR